MSNIVSFNNTTNGSSLYLKINSIGFQNETKNSDYLKILTDILIVLTIIGVLGDGICLYVLLRPKLRKEPFFRYMFVATILDILNQLFIYFIHFELPLFVYFFKLFLLYSAWIIVLSLIDQYFAVKYPYKFKFRKDFKFQVIVILVSFFVLCLLNVPDIFGFLSACLNDCNKNYEKSFVFNYSKCLNNCVNISTLQEFINFSFLFVYLPFILMILCSVLTFRELVTKKLNTHNTNLKRAIKMLLVSISLSSFFLICNLPFSIYNLIKIILNWEYDHTENDFFLEIFHSIILLFFYFTCDFLMLITFNKVFRNEFVSIFCRKRG